MILQSNTVKGRRDEGTKGRRTPAYTSADDQSRDRKGADGPHSRLDAVNPQSSISNRRSTVAAPELTNSRLPIRQLTMFTRQMAMLLTSGSGVVPALSSIARQFTKPAHARIVRQVCLDLEQGETLAVALRKQPRTFDPAYCAIIAAGEASATLPEMFNRLAKMVGKRRVVRNKVMGAMAYPVLLSGMSIGILGVLLFFVMPRFGGMFDTLGVDLPASTAFLIALGEAVKSYWFVGLPLLLAVGTGLVFVIKSPSGRQRVSDLSLQIPLIGRLIAGLIQGETFRVLGMLIEARVGVLEAIELVRGITTNRRFQNLYNRMASEVTAGGSISKALETSSLISPAICHAIRTGEDSGQLGAAASYVADVLEEDNAELIETATKLIEPAILIVMGLVVGAVSVSLFMPLFDMTSAI